MEDLTTQEAGSSLHMHNKYLELRSLLVPISHVPLMFYSHTVSLTSKMCFTEIHLKTTVLHHLYAVLQFELKTSTFKAQRKLLQCLRFLYITNALRLEAPCAVSQGPCASLEFLVVQTILSTPDINSKYDYNQYFSN